MTRILADLRHAVRLLLRSPGFTLASVAVLAVGIGAGTAIFSVVDNILFRPLDIPDAGRVVTVCEANETRDYCYGASTPNIADWLESTRTLEELGAARPRTYPVETATDRSWASVGMAMPGFLRAAGARTARGRLISEADMPPGSGGEVVVVSHGYWQGELGGDPGVIGRTLVLDDVPHTVVGVLEPETYVPRLDWVRLWIPLPWNPQLEENRDWRGLATAGRLVPGATVEEAEEELSALYAGMTEAHPEALRGWTVEVRSMQDYLVGGTRTMLLVLLGAVVAVLLVVCVNMASLLLTRATARERELAVRAALGAGNVALARHLLSESLVLALAGGAGGVLLAFWGTDAFLALAPPGIPRIDEVAVDGRILAFAGGASVLSGLAFGLAPMLRARRVEIAGVLKAGRTRGSGRDGGGLRKGLVVAEVALAMVLVTSAALLIRSFTGLLDWRPGFETENVVTFQLFFPNPGAESPEAGHRRLVDLHRSVEERVEAIPGVRSVGTTSGGILLPGGDGVSPFFVEGRARAPVEAAPVAAWFNVGPGYFRTLGIPLVRGRHLRESDGPGSPPVALVNQAMVRRHWPDGDVLGARLHLPELHQEVEVVGVVRDVPPFDPGEAPDPELYFSNRQYTRGAAYFVARTDVEAASVVPALEPALGSVHPDLRPSAVRTLEELVDRRLVVPRFNASLLGVFALVALVLGAVGVYGVVAYTVELRTREIGIRLALGAGRERVLRRILARGALLVGIGMALGLVAAALSTRFLSGMLHGVAPDDPATFAVTAAFLLGTGLAAVALPALRASRTSPLVAIREE